MSDDTELASIGKWFDDRGVVLVFTGRGTGVGPTPPPIQTWTANLIDKKADKLVGRFDAPFRLQAAREARAWWSDHQDTKHVETALTLAWQIEAADLPADKVERAKRQGLQLVYTAPTEGDAESGWMIEVYDDTGELRGMGLGSTAEDALTTVLEDLLPDEGH